jgi:CheY-like chemotaxis protein
VVPEPVRRRAEALRAAVLVVDDEPSVLELQIAILETHGAEVVGARSGSEACDRLRERTFDLVVTDLKMPGSISGQDLFRWAQRERPEIARRFVFVTGDTMSEDALVFLEATGRRCVQKPFSVEGYLDVLRDTLEGRERAAA